LTCVLLVLNSSLARAASMPIASKRRSCDPMPWS
jgi:hypothetical protein